MQVRDTPVLIEADSHPATLIVGAGGSGINYGPSQSNLTGSAAPGTSVMLAAPTWVVSQGGRDGHPADVVLVDTPASPSAGSGRALAARRVLAGVPSRLLDAQALHTNPPAVTIPAANAATSITSGIRLHALLTPDGTQIDTEKDPHFGYVDQRPGHLPVTDGSYGYPDLLTGGATQGRRDNTRIRFAYTGNVIEVGFRARTTSLIYRLWVDGLPLTADYQTAATGATLYQAIKLDFTVSDPGTTHIIEVEVLDPEFYGAFIEPTATISRVRANKPALMGFGDSVTAGSGPVKLGNSWVYHLSRLLGAEWLNRAIGGTGFLNTGGSTGGDFRSRVTPDIVSTPPDMLVIFGGYNDVASFTSAQIGAEALYVYQQLVAQLPNTVIIAVGIWIPNSASWPQGAAADAAMKASAQQAGIPFVSLLDPTQTGPVTGDGSAPAWAASTAYVVGNPVVANGWVQKCVVAHTSTASFDQTKFKPTTFNYGTGKTGTTTGDGNADVNIYSDGIHPTQLGAKALAYHLRQAFIPLLRSVAGTA